MTCRPVITIRHDSIDGTLWAAWCAGCRWDGPQRHNEGMARIDLDHHRNQQGESE
jgi:hypothetical protein